MVQLLVTAVVGLAAILPIAIVLLFYRCGRRRELEMMRQWAENNQYELIQWRQRRFAESAPFSFWTTHRTPNYFVTVRDRDGKQRSAWIRLGTIFQSIYGREDEVEVRWQDERSAVQS